MLEVGKVIGEGFCNRVHEVKYMGESYVAKRAIDEDADLPWEWEALQAINKINTLLPKCIDFLKHEDLEYLVIEQVYSIPIASTTQEERVLLLENFLVQLKELHAAGWSHGDIKRPRWVPEDETWDNILLTGSGIRLVDAGAASKGDKEQVDKDLLEFEEFSVWLMNQ
jgi:tRNA A-37 threonylcarbamoyl transferase component Bud32